MRETLISFEHLSIFSLYQLYKPSAVAVEKYGLAEAQGELDIFLFEFKHNTAVAALIWNEKRLLVNLVVNAIAVDFLSESFSANKAKAKTSCSLFERVARLLVILLSSDLVCPQRSVQIHGAENARRRG